MGPSSYRPKPAGVAAYLSFVVLSNAPNKKEEERSLTMILRCGHFWARSWANDKAVDMPDLAFFLTSLSSARVCARQTVAVMIAQ